MPTLEEKLISSESGRAPDEAGAGTERPWCGCIPCSKLVAWRGYGGANVFAYKALGSVLIVGMMLKLMSIYYTRGRFLLVFFAGFTMVKFLSEAWGQEGSTWIVPKSPIFFVAFYALGLSSMGYTFTCISSPDIPERLPGGIPRDLAGAALFLGGTLYAWTYELGRFRWKRDPANKGRLHTIHHAKYHIHPNYFGDILTYSGWALVGGTTCFLSLPVMSVWWLLICICPNSDAYLAERYSREFPEYARHTATLIPCLHSWAANQCAAWLALAVSAYMATNCAGPQCA